MTKIQILLVEDNLLVADAVKDILAAENYDVIHAEDGKTAKAALADQTFAIALLDMMLPDTDGRKLLQAWRQQYPQMLVIIMTAYGDVNAAVECLKLGAHDFLTKPVEKILLLKTIKNSVDHQQLSTKVTVLTQLNQRGGDPLDSGSDIIARAPSMLKTLEMATVIARSDFSCLLIRGESGTGKGLFARTIHKMGPRHSKPFVEVNCSALPATLIESELFGHRRGAFTDAKEDKIGLFQMADGGTLFLDEIGDMDVALQAKLLKVIEEQKFRQIGGVKDITVDVTIIAATNQDVEQQIQNNTFRVDLYYRLNVIPLELPPLRERMEDIAALAEHFIRVCARKFGKRIDGFSDDAMQALMAYNWPGNVREFRNVVERGSILTQQSVITREALLFPTMAPSAAAVAPCMTTTAATAATITSLPAMPLARAEEMVIRAAMLETDDNKNEAARILGIHRTTLYKKLEEYNICS